MILVAARRPAKGRMVSSTPLNEEAFCPDPCNNINSPLNSSFVIAGRVGFDINNNALHFGSDRFGVVFLAGRLPLDRHFRGRAKTK